MAVKEPLLAYVMSHLASVMSHLASVMSHLAFTVFRELQPGLSLLLFAPFLSRLSAVRAMVLLCFVGSRLSRDDAARILIKPKTN